MRWACRTCRKTRSSVTTNRGWREPGRADELIRQWVKVSIWVALYAVLDQFRVPYGGVNSIADIFADPHFAAREDLVTIEDHVGTVVTPAPYPRLSHAPGRVYNPAPTIGEHNDEVYCGLLGMTAEEVESLTALGVI